MFFPKWESPHPLEAKNFKAWTSTVIPCKRLSIWTQIGICSRNFTSLKDSCINSHSPSYRTLERSKNSVSDMYISQVSSDEWTFSLGNGGQEEVMPRTSIKNSSDSKFCTALTLSWCTVISQRSLIQETKENTNGSLPPLHNGTVLLEKKFITEQNSAK